MSGWKETVVQRDGFEYTAEWHTERYDACWVQWAAKPKGMDWRLEWWAPNWWSWSDVDANNSSVDVRVGGSPLPANWEIL